MTAVGKWCATYAPGDWLVLCGPASVVVIEPPGEGWTPLVAELWQQVLAASSLVDLADRLARYGLDSMPSFGALFWSADGMRSLVRGSVSVVDPDSGRVVADGSGIQTWSEVGLGDLVTARVQTGSDAAPAGLELPLVVGAVRASSVLLDAREQARVHSPQVDAPADEQLADEEPDEPTGPTELADPTEPTEPFADEPTPAGGSASWSEEPTEVEPTQLLAEEQVRGLAAPGLTAEDGDTALVAAVPEPAPGVALVEAVLCPHGHPNRPATQRCRSCGVRVTDPRPRRVPQPVLAVLRVSDGAEAVVDRPVLVGRAPADRAGGGSRLLTVPSPSHDISRTHLEVAPDGWDLLVTDLHSTNGTLVTRPGSSDRELLPPGLPVPVRLGSVIELADGVSVLLDDAQ